MYRSSAYTIVEKAVLTMAIKNERDVIMLHVSNTFAQCCLSD
jgi:hypothetical protein